MIDLKLRLATFTTAVLVAGSFSACGSDSTDVASESGQPSAEVTSLTVSDAWSRQPAAGQTVAAVYATVSNPTDADVAIVAASSPVTPDVELHETVSNDDGTMSMRQVTEGYVVPAGGELVLAAGGAHIMLIGIDPATYPVDQVEVTIELDGGESVSFEASVQALAGDSASAMDDMDHEHDHGAADDHEHDQDTDENEHDHGAADENENEHDHGAADDHENEHDHGADDEASADDPLDVRWLHELDDELADGTLDPDRQRSVIAPFIAHYEEMAPAEATDEAELLAALRDLDQALVDQDLDRAAALAKAAHETAHHIEGHA